MWSRLTSRFVGVWLGSKTPADHHRLPSGVKRSARPGVFYPSHTPTNRDVVVSLILTPRRADPEVETTRQFDNDSLPERLFLGRLAEPFVESEEDGVPDAA